MRERSSILIFANPIAGRGRGRRIAERLRTRLLADGFDPEIVTDRPDCFDLARLDRPASAAIVIGGDGTLRAVAHRLYLDPCEIEPGAGGPSVGTIRGDPPLLIVPLGTANLMGRHLGIRWNDRTLEDQVARAISGARVVASTPPARTVGCSC